MRGVAALAVFAVILVAPVALSQRDRNGFALGVHRGVGTTVVPSRRAVATDQVNVSHARAAQAEVAVVVDPTDPEVLLAGSGSFERSNRVYTSADGGATWTSAPLPAPRGVCALGDPAVAIDDAGRQYYAYLVGSCFDVDLRRVDLALATRADAAAAWNIVKPSIPGAAVFNDKDAIAVDTSSASPYHRRVYLAWSRLFRPSNAFEVVVAHSDDDGATWSRAVRVAGTGGPSQTFAGLAVGADGTLYVTWLTVDQHVELARSTDGGATFGRTTLVTLTARLPLGSCSFGGTGLPAQPKRCVSPAPLVTVDRVRGRVYVTWSAAGDGGREENVYVSAFDAATLKPVVQERQVNPLDGAVPSDQFLPASAVDESTGRLWACWYDTTGDRTRKRTRYTCAASDDGGAAWSAPAPAASVFSNETVRRATSFEYGDYAGLAAANGVAHPMWTDTRDLASNGEEIFTTALQLP